MITRVRADAIQSSDSAVTSQDLTKLLRKWRKGDQAALDGLFPLIRAELRLLARRHLAGERKDHSIQPSSLVQEAFLRLLPDQNIDWQSRAHFFALASQVMRHVLVDYARRRRRPKHGSAAVHVHFDDAVILGSDQLDEVIAVDLALQRLAEVDPRKCRVLEMRLFGGLSIDETAKALGIGTNTVIRDWNFARAWLRRELANE